MDAACQKRSLVGTMKKYHLVLTASNGNLIYHYLYLEIHKNLVDRYLDFCQTLDRVIRRR
jgi:hypothetical protein